MAKLSSTFKLTCYHRARERLGRNEEGVSMSNVNVTFVGSGRGAKRERRGGSEVIAE
jgi:hypothetical protein